MDCGSVAAGVEDVLEAAFLEELFGFLHLGTGHLDEAFLRGRGAFVLDEVPIVILK